MSLPAIVPSRRHLQKIKRPLTLLKSGRVARGASFANAHSLTNPRQITNAPWGGPGAGRALGLLPLRGFAQCQAMYPSWPDAVTFELPARLEAMTDTSPLNEAAEPVAVIIQPGYRGKVFRRGDGMKERLPLER